MENLNKRAQLQISFGWLFAIIAGIFILALAIYFSVKFIDLGSEASGAKTISEIEVLLNPLETSFESGKTTFLELPVETRIINECSEFGEFGTQRLSLEQKSFNEFKRIETTRSSKNKYIFSNESVQGKTFNLFSKPFEMPFKISDVIYLTSANTDYCFINAPENIVDELENLNQKNLKTKNCVNEGINVCFGVNPPGLECDVNVNTISESSGNVEKNGERVFYETDSLMYAAIFSDKETYECQIKRLMGRLNSLSFLYEDKKDTLADKGCSVEVSVLTLASFTGSFEDSEDLIGLKVIAESVDKSNDLSRCRLW